MMTGASTACHSAQCTLHCPRLRAIRAASAAGKCCCRKQHNDGPTSTRGGRHHILDVSRQVPKHPPQRCSAYAADQYSELASPDELEGRSQEEARASESDKSELKQLARMMPDPAEDELFDDRDPADLVGASEHQLLQQHGLSSQLLLGEDMFASDYSPDVSQDFGEPEGYGEGYDNYYSQSSDMIAVDMKALEFFVDGRRRGEKQKAQEMAFDMFHAQGTSEINIYSQTLVFAQIMENLDVQDKIEGRVSRPLPKWIRAQFRFADGWEKYAEWERQQLSHMPGHGTKRVMAENAVADRAPLSMEEQARAMLAEDDFTTQPLMAAFEAQSTRQASPSLAVQADDSEFDQFLTILPGAEREASQALQRMMGPLSPYLDEEDLEES